MQPQLESTQPQQLFEDPNLAPDQSGLSLTPGENVPGVGLSADSGIGVSDASAPVARPSPRDEVKARFDQMPMLQKIGTAMGEFGAGVQGRASPLRGQVEEERKNRLLKVAEAKESVTALDHGVSVAQKLSGDAKEAFIKDYAAQLDETSPGLGKTFGHLAAQPGLLADFQKYMPYLPEPMKLLAKDNPGEFIKMIGKDPKALEDARQQYLLKSGTDKARLTMGSVKAHPEALVAAGVPQELIDAFTKQPSASTFGAINDALPGSSPSKLNADEMLSANQHPVFHQSLGMLSPAGEEEIKKKGTEKADADTPFMKEAAARFGKDTPEYKKAIEAHLAKESGTGEGGGAGTKMVQDPDTGQVYQVNQRAGKAWTFDQEGQRTEIPVSNLPKKLTDVGKMGTAGAREAVFTQRVIQAGNQASKDLENVVKLPIKSDRGPFGAFGSVSHPSFMDAGKTVLGNKMTTEDSQIYNAMSTGFQRTLAAIESAGLMPSGNLTSQMDSVIFKPGDTNLTKMHKLAQTRQIVESGLEVVLSNPRISDSEKDKAKEIIGRLKEAVPFTHSDLIDLIHKQGSNPNVTMRQIIDNKLNPKTAKGPETQEAYTKQFGKPPPSIGNKDGFDKLKPGDGYIDSRDGSYKVKG
jgi:hypothetical protein